MIDEYDILETNFRRQTYPEFNITLHGIADSIDTHDFFKNNWEEYVAGSVQFRSRAARIKELGIGADRGDSLMKEQREAERALAQLDLETAAKYMVVRAVEKREPSLLHGTGFPYKAQPTKSSSRTVSAKSVPITLTAQHVKGKSGVAMIKGKHVRNGGPYLLQICKGEPSSEDSWSSPGGHYMSCSKIIVQNLEPANRYYFRMRSDGPEGAGPWSQVASLIIL